MLIPLFDNEIVKSDDNRIVCHMDPETENGIRQYYYLSNSDYEKKIACYHHLMTWLLA
jgi:hypothetical protein